MVAIVGAGTGSDSPCYFVYAADASDSTDANNWSSNDVMLAIKSVSCGWMVLIARSGMLILIKCTTRLDSTLSFDTKVAVKVNGVSANDASSVVAVGGACIHSCDCGDDIM